MTDTAWQTSLHLLHPKRKNSELRLRKSERRPKVKPPFRTHKTPPTNDLTDGRRSDGRTSVCAIIGTVLAFSVFSVFRALGAFCPGFGSCFQSYCTTLLGGHSWMRFCQQEFGEFPRPAWAVGGYSSGPSAGGTPQILVDKTSPMSGRLRV